MSDDLVKRLRSFDYCDCAERTRQAADEIERLRGVIAQTLAAMEALSPTASGDMSDADYARLWNATMEMLENG